MSSAEQASSTPSVGTASFASTQAAPPIRVLVVDDNVDAADVLVMLLERKGCTVEAAHSGSAALAAFERALPDLVLLDLGLPDMDGASVARQLRTRDLRPVLVAVSGFTEDSGRGGEPDLFVRHLLKPVDVAALDDILATLRTRSSS